jgi:hypothetical protein
VVLRNSHISWNGKRHAQVQATGSVGSLSQSHQLISYYSDLIGYEIMIRTRVLILMQ